MDLIDYHVIIAKVALSESKAPRILVHQAVADTHWHKPAKSYNDPVQLICRPQYFLSAYSSPPETQKIQENDQLPSTTDGSWL